MIYVYFIAFEECGKNGGPKAYCIKGELITQDSDNHLNKGYFKVEDKLSWLSRDGDGCISLQKIALSEEELNKKISDFYSQEVKYYEEKIKYIKEKMSKPVEISDL